MEKAKEIQLAENEDNTDKKYYETEIGEETLEEFASAYNELIEQQNNSDPSDSSSSNTKNSSSGD